MANINKINTNYKMKEINRPGSLQEDLNKMPENLTFNKMKKFSTKSNLFPNKNIYFKTKIKKNCSNYSNNIIINNNTNIINNNNINIINNNIINSDEKELNHSISQLNILPIPKPNYDSNFIYPNKNIPNIIFNKRRISLNNNIAINYRNNKVVNNTQMFTNNSNINKPNINEINNNNIIKNNNNVKNQKENSTILNVEEILMIEEKLSSLINCLNNNNPCAEESFECINFYFTTNFSKNIDNYFTKENISKIINKALNIKIFSFIICYDISLHENIFMNYIAILKQIISNVHSILILISKFFCNKIISNKSNLWVTKLYNLTNKYDPKVKSINLILDEINFINNKLTQKLII